MTTAIHEKPPAPSKKSRSDNRTAILVGVTEVGNLAEFESFSEEKLGRKNLEQLADTLELFGWQPYSLHMLMSDMDLESINRGPARDYFEMNSWNCCFTPVDNYELEVLVHRRKMYGRLVPGEFGTTVPMEINGLPFDKRITPQEYLLPGMTEGKFLSSSEAFSLIMEGIPAVFGCDNQVDRIIRYRKLLADVIRSFGNEKIQKYKSIDEAELDPKHMGMEVFPISRGGVYLFGYR